MRVYDRYLLSLALVFFSTTLLLAWIKERRLDFYLMLYLLEFSGVSLLYAYFNPRGRWMVGAIGYVLFLAFVVIVGSFFLRRLGLWPFR